MNTEKRSLFATRTGVIAATVGSAVGLGNIWRFPYEAGTHGGGAFLLVYVVCVFAIGVPVMLSEFAIGRATHRGALGALRSLSPRSPIRAVAYTGILSGMMILSFYSVVAGWIMEYLYQSVAALFTGSVEHSYATEFEAFKSSAWRPSLWTLIFLGLNLLVIRRRVDKGIERLSNALMPALFVIMVVFCVNSLLLPKAGEGLSFMFKPDFSQLTPSTVIGAMGQAFFSLSLGLTCLLTYSSYFSDDTPLVRSAVITAVLDTLVAVMSGMIIFPAVFSYGLAPEAGPTLVFETLPAIFAQMPGGALWSVAFFLLLFFASITSTISMSEIAIPYFVEEKGMKRGTAASLVIGVCAFFGVVCALSFGPLASVKVFGLTVFDLFDYTTSNILLPCGGIMLSLFAGWWLERRVVWEQLTNRGATCRRLVPVIRFCMRWTAPSGILVVFIYNLL